MPKFLIVLVLVVDSVLVAQEKKQESAGSFGFHTGPHAPLAAPRDIDWPKQSEIVAVHEASRAWRSEHPGWQFLFDPRTNNVWRAFGPGIQAASAHAEKVE